MKLPRMLLPLIPMTALLASCGGPSTPAPSAVSGSAQTSPTAIQNADAGDQAMTADEQLILAATNAARATGQTCGKTFYPAAPAVTWNGYLAAAARAYAQDMATRNYFHHDHTDLQGRKPSQRVEAAGYTGWRRVTENIAAGVTVKTVVDEWIASETHCVNLMDPNLKEVGIGLTTSRTSTYGTYFVQDFGTR